MISLRKGVWLCAAVLSSWAAPASASVLKRPYLIYPGQNTQMQVVWQDDTAGETNTVRWGTNAACSTDATKCSSSAAAPEFGDSQHSYTMTGLAPNTKYYYQVNDQAGAIYGSGSFITAPEDDATSIRFLGMGDSRSQPIALDNMMKAMRNFYAQPGNEDYQRLVIHNGDWVSTDGESYWTTQWFDPNMTDIVAFTANSPLDGVKGNHDNAKGYSTTFPKYFPFPYPNKTACDPNAVTCPTTAAFNNLYWSMDYGPVHFTFVDEYSSYAPGSPQYAWLVNDLATTAKPWKILVYHEPSYSAGKDGDNVTARSLESLVTQYNVDLIYAGHSHNYARTGAYNLAQANGDPIALNVPHITSGGGGAPVYEPDMTNKGKFPHVITAWPSYEFMTFDVKGNTLTMTAYQVNHAYPSPTALAAGATPAIQPVEQLTLSKIETIVLHHFTNVTSLFSTHRSAFVYNKKTGHYTGNLIITNNGPALAGTIDVVLDGVLHLQGLGDADNQYSTGSTNGGQPLTSKIAQNTGLVTDATLVNATGSNNGEPMIRATTKGIPAGGEVVIPLELAIDPTTQSITPNSATLDFFTPVILQE